MLTYNISEFLHGRIDREIVIKTLDKDESNDGHQRLLRSTKRFLLRYSQFTDKVHGNGDFLAALRDFILLAGGFVLPNHLARIVKEHGQDFGLYLENDNFVKAELGKLDSLVPRVFLNDIYDLNYKKNNIKEESIGDRNLFEITNYKNYRSYAQKIAVHTAMNLPSGSSLILSLPTGAGKSLITHMVTAKSEGLTVCVVPTVSLGIDQERQAKAVLSNMEEQEIVFYGGNVTAQKRAKILADLEFQKIKLLIISPEALVRNEKLRDFLFNAAESAYLKYLVIDEAHIVQDWGADFRPDFQLLSLLRRQLLEECKSNLKTVLLSATITEHTNQILKEMFSEGNNCVCLNFDSLRKEPRYILNKVEFYGQKEARVLEYCRTLPKPLIIYETRPEEAEKWKRFLNKHGFKSVVTFTGETRNKERNEIIKKWSDDEFDIVVGTAAFGLGIDKSDVRTVVHATVPGSINRFYQEVGRGGRDGFPSLSILLNCTRESIRNSGSILSMNKLLPRWFSMLSAGENQGSDVVLLDMNTPPEYFSEEEKELRGQRNRNWNIGVILFLIRHKFIELLDLEYDSSLDGRYYVWVRLLELKVLQDREIFEVVVSKKRELETGYSRAEFEAMLNLAGGKKYCWGNYFVELFPNAEYVCAGCLAHEDTILNIPELTIQEKIPLWKRDGVPKITQSILKGQVNLLIPKTENLNSMDREIVEKLATITKNLALSAVIIPESLSEFAGCFPTLTLSPKDGKDVIINHVSLFSNGVLCILPNDRTGIDLYMVFRELEMQDIPVLYFAKPNMSITPFSRNLNHLITGYKVTLDQLLEASSVV